jgi:hypothetical protein
MNVETLKKISTLPINVHFIVLPNEAMTYC